MSENTRPPVTLSPDNYRNVLISRHHGQMSEYHLPDMTCDERPDVLRITKDRKNGDIIAVAFDPDGFPSPPGLKPSIEAGPEKLKEPAFLEAAKAVAAHMSWWDHTRIFSADDTSDYANSLATLHAHMLQEWDTAHGAKKRARCVID